MHNKHSKLTGIQNYFLMFIQSQFVLRMWKLMYVFFAVSKEILRSLKVSPAFLSVSLDTDTKFKIIFVFPFYYLQKNARYRQQWMSFFFFFLNCQIQNWFLLKIVSIYHTKCSIYLVVFYKFQTRFFFRIEHPMIFLKDIGSLL